ncbi:hypothetical protein GE09DRAFT_1223586 [Coniochaeta sp. 2T2.1]|nr:hypothetical protein GE09DRAFT_1223586 [Coniochaeta sp. 2T2.1]
MSSSSPPTIKVEDVPRRPPVLGLPVEIVHLIADRYLSSLDCKSLRLSCRFFDAPMVHSIFRRVIISKSLLDRDNFFSIAGKPHLAAAARELIWYELAEDETVFIDLKPGAKAEEHLVNLPPLSKPVTTVFWWPSQGSSKAYRKESPEDYIEKLSLSRKPALKAFLPRFFIALDAMPNVHTFVSCPMPGDHTVQKDRESYPLTAQLYQRGLGWKPEHTNDGFFYFLLPAMRRPGAKIERLAYADEGMKSSVSRLRASDLLSFMSLTHIDVCLGHGEGEEHELDDLHACLRAAQNLVDLRFCAEKTQKRVPRPAAAQEALKSLFRTGGGGEQMWPHLRRLEFTEFGVATRGRVRDMVKIVKAHASTLRHLSFHQCEVNRRLIEGMAEIPLQLDSLQVVNKSSLSARIVPKSELLAYVNGTGPRPSILGKDTSWNTEIMIFDLQHMPTAALYDASTPRETVYSKEDMADVLDQHHPDNRGMIRAYQSLWAKEKLAKLSKLNLAKATNVVAGGSSHFADATESPNISKWLFRHPNGQEAVGDEPLDFFSDWEDSCDEGYTGADEEIADAPAEDHDDGSPDDWDGSAGEEEEPEVDQTDAAVDSEGNEKMADADQNDSDEGDADERDQSDDSEFEAENLIARMEAPVAMLQRRYLAIPLIDVGGAD